MVQREIVASGLKIKQKSIFDLDELYKGLFRWFELYGYVLQELEYRDSVEGDSKHLEIKWKAEKEIDDYVMYVIRLNFLILGLQKVEVEENGAKVKKYTGDLEMNFYAFLAKDYKNKWSDSGYSKVFRELYDKYIIKNRMEGIYKELYEELYKVMDEVKAFLNLHRF